MHVAWLFARSPSRHRVRENRTDLSAHGVFTPFVREALTQSGILPGAAQASPHELPEMLAEFDGQTVGVMLVKPRGYLKHHTVMSPPERALRDYWMLTRFGPSNLFQVDVVRAVRLAHPISVNQLYAGQVPKGLFFKVSPHSCATLEHDAVDANGVRVQEHMARWSSEFGDCFPQQAATAAEGVRTFPPAVGMPVAHALLVASGHWPVWSFPLCHGRVAAGLGLGLVETWMAGHRPPELADAPR